MTAKYTCCIADYLGNQFVGSHMHLIAFLVTQHYLHLFGG